jgi:hypothetical protein
VWCRFTWDLLQARAGRVTKAGAAASAGHIHTANSEAVQAQAESAAAGLQNSAGASSSSSPAAVLLTTHSMDEAEALADYVVIMVRLTYHVIVFLKLTLP